MGVISRYCNDMGVIPSVKPTKQKLIYHKIHIKCPQTDIGVVSRYYNDMWVVPSVKPTKQKLISRKIRNKCPQGHYILSKGGGGVYLNA